MHIMEKFINNYLSLIITGMVVLNLLMLMIIIINMVKLSKIKAKYKKITNNIGHKSIEEILSIYYSQVDNAINRSNEIVHRIDKIENNLKLCVQKIGVIRYKAFEDVGSDLSFAIALLDAEDNGVVINSIFSRENSSIYAKPIINGKSQHALAAEEIQAIDMAKRTYNAKNYR